MTRRWASLVSCPYFVPIILGIIGTLLVLASLGNTSSWEILPGPGTTIDETIYVPRAKIYTSTWNQFGLAFFDHKTVEIVFGTMPDHPPLGTWLLGWTHWLTDDEPNNLDVFNITGARPWSAIAYGCLIALTGYWASQLLDSQSGWMASLATLLMPRIFAHAHLAALDITITLAYLLSLWSIYLTLHPSTRTRKIVLAGLIFGLAISIKIHGWVVFVTVIPWDFWNWKLRAIRPLCIWTATGLVVFILSWPWLWPWLWDSPFIAWEHLVDYFFRTWNRASLQVWYFDQAIPDHSVPFHYPWVMFLSTVPTGLHLLGIVGVVTIGKKWFTNSDWSLVGAGFLVILTLFSIPGIVVYDGVRLFLMVFPLWSILVGVGSKTVWDWLHIHSRFHHSRRLIFVFLFCCYWLSQATGMVSLHPYQLSYYNLLVGGLHGADKLGLEVTYWGDTVNRELKHALVNRASDGDQVQYRPQMYPNHTYGVVLSSPNLLQRNYRWMDDSRLSRSLFPPAQNKVIWSLIYNRTAYLQPDKQFLSDAELIYEVSRDKVWLSRLYRTVSQTKTDRTNTPAKRK